LRAARALIEAGADVNATAAIDDHGLYGHTPLFHTVNSIGNRSDSPGSIRSWICIWTWDIPSR
jgi:hypothetical protein